MRVINDAVERARFELRGLEELARALGVEWKGPGSAIGDEALEEALRKVRGSAATAVARLHDAAVLWAQERRRLLDGLRWFDEEVGWDGEQPYVKPWLEKALEEYPGRVS